MKVLNEGVRAQLAAVDISKVKSGSLRKRLAKFRNKASQGGFTLLELLVVVAILAAIASTATIMLQDTDRRSEAATHVAIMDELNKGIATWRVLHQAQFPNVYESLLESGTNDTTAGALIGELDGGLTPFLGTHALTADEVGALSTVGVTQVRVLNTGGTAPGGGSCATVDDRRVAMLNKNNDFVNSNLFRAPNATSDRGGCGFDANYVLAAAALLPQWATTENYRINAGPNDVVLALGLGPDNTLFGGRIPNGDGTYPTDNTGDNNSVGTLSTTPLYRHVDNVTYNHFIALVNLSTTDGEPKVQAVIDASGDTRDEELGEFDGTRSTL